MTERPRTDSTSTNAMSPTPTTGRSTSASPPIAAYSMDSSTHIPSILSLPLTMAFELDLTNENSLASKGAIENTRLKEDATIMMDLQHGFQVCVRGLPQGLATGESNAVGMVELTFHWSDKDSRHRDMSSLIPAIKTLRILGENKEDGSLGVHLSTAIHDPKGWTQHGISVFLDESELIPATLATMSMATSTKARRRFLVTLSRCPIRFFFPFSVLDPVPARLHKKPFGQSLLSQFLVRAAKESALAASNSCPTLGTSAETTAASIDEVTAAVDSLTFGGNGKIRTSDVEFVANPTISAVASRSPGLSTTAMTVAVDSSIARPQALTDPPRPQHQDQQQQPSVKRAFGDFNLIIAAHQSILQCWPEFASLFQNHSRPLDRPMQLKSPPGLDLLALQYVIQFLYLGQIQGPGYHFYSYHHPRQNSLSAVGQVADGRGAVTRIEIGGVETSVVGSGGMNDVDWRKIFQVAYRFGVQPLVDEAIERLLQEHEGYPVFTKDSSVAHDNHFSQSRGSTDPCLQYTFGVKKRCPIQTLFQWAHQYSDLETRLLNLIFQHHLADLASADHEPTRASAAEMATGPNQGKDFVSADKKVETHAEKKRAKVRWEQHQKLLRREQQARLESLHQKLNRFQSHPEFSRIHNIILARILGENHSNPVPLARRITCRSAGKQVLASSPDHHSNCNRIPQKRKLSPELIAAISDKHPR